MELLSETGAVLAPAHAPVNTGNNWTTTLSTSYSNFVATTKYIIRITPYDAETSSHFATFGNIKITP